MPTMIAELLTASSRLSLPDAAALFGSAGVPVFPCAPGAKRPLTEHGFHDATTNSDQISAWWRRWPAANIGIPTGTASGIDVVDVDVHGEESGFPALRAARHAGLIPAWSGLVRSPSGGLHLYFPANPDQPQSSWQAPKAHVDFRGTGGYIIAPPSQVTQPDGTSGVYELRAAGVAAALPVDANALRSFLDPRPPVQPRRDGSVQDLNADRLGRWVASLCEGERNRGLFWAACRLAEAGADPADTLAALGPAAEHIGLSGREVSATIRSAYRTTTPAPAGNSRPFPDAPRSRVPAVAGRGL